MRHAEMQQIAGHRPQLSELGADDFETPRQPDRHEVVTHLLGTFRYPCLRAGQAAGWRRGRDSNPRYSLRPYDALAKRCLQPLGHLSGASLMPLITWGGQFGSVCFRSNIPSDFRNKRVCSRG
ncbi:protein of unknown function [Bradyrhizobium vignae]|uniref:Uncharacterized protein n=1 Tax=Bradyrhizobium vignae TaxID=1549949 RepID=A0A2U3Q0Q4_9BRAD|nr:protein of unknown function [Bradyrhizobium vignae]